MQRSLSIRWYLCCHKYRRNLMYIQKCILLNAALFLRRIQQTIIQYHYKPNKKKRNLISQNRSLKQERYVDEINDKSGNYCKQLMDKVLTWISFYVRRAFAVTESSSHPVCIRLHLNAIPSPLSTNLIIECPLMWYARFSNYFCWFYLTLMRRLKQVLFLPEPKNYLKVDTF